MAQKKGTIKTFKAEGGFGFITPEGNGPDLFFHISETWDFVGDPQEGVEVLFEIKAGKGGKPAATKVHPTEAKGPGYRFLNPYNFVRLPRPSQAVPDDMGARLLSRCQPPPHDRWIGLNGKLVCEVEAVTPIFISDAEAYYASKSLEKKDHKTYRFFRYDFGDGPESKPDPALPASSLRGMVRNVFESVTNSCFAHFDYAKRLSYHLPANDALKLTPARVEKDAEGRWQLRLLPGTATLTIGNRPHDMLYAARVEQYEALSNIIKGLVAKVTRYFVKRDGLAHGSECWALVARKQFPPVWNVLELAPFKDEHKLRAKAKGDVKLVKGYLCINNQNIETKRFERFFFRDPQNNRGAEFVPLLNDIREKYLELINDYRERHAETVKKWKKEGHGNRLETYREKLDDNGSVTGYEVGLSRFILGESYELKVGELVYAMLSGTTKSPSVEFIVPVAIPRVGYERRISQLLPMHAWKCNSYDTLCPACRTFGWVYGSAPGDHNALAREQLAAYAGRVRFSHGRLKGSLERLDDKDIPLAILSSPKPTTTRFYLKPSYKTPRPGLEDALAGYDNKDNVLRGRKFFRHHGHGRDKSYWRSNEREYRLDKPSDQNRSLADAAAPGTKFTFTVDFENLAAVELGALLWSLQLPENAYHRLGFAKPLGFGSVKITVRRASILNAGNRYGEQWLQNDAVIENEALQNWIAALIEKFEETMSRAYTQPFEELEHVREILALLRDPAPDLPVHYPRSQKQPSEEGKNFEWFMGNNRNKQARLVLELPSQEEGLPLIDKKGTILS